MILIVRRARKWKQTESYSRSSLWTPPSSRNFFPCTKPSLNYSCKTVRNCYLFLFLKQNTIMCNYTCMFVIIVSFLGIFQLLERQEVSFWFIQMEGLIKCALGFVITFFFLHRLPHFPHMIWSLCLE